MSNSYFLKTAVIALNMYFGAVTTASAADSAEPEVIDGVKFEQRFAEVNGIQMHYLIAGDGRKPVLLIHGFPGDWRNWKLIMGKLVNQGYTAVVPDFRGAGKSSAPSSGYDKKTMAQDMHALMRSLGFKETAIVGHDIGTNIAYLYAAQFPGEVKKLVLMDSFLPGIPGWEQGYDGRPGKWHFRFFGDTALQLVKGRERTYVDMFWNEFVVPGNPSVPEADRATLAKDYAREGRMKVAFALYSTWPINDAPDNQAYATKKLEIPVLSIGGDHSRGKTLAEQMPQIAENPQSLIIKNSGHFVLEEKTDETSAAIFKFLKD
jgi:pimeloyl-ACP methyl ester carboxylesterase